MSEERETSYASYVSPKERAASAIIFGAFLMILGGFAVLAWPPKHVECWQGMEIGSTRRC